MIFYKETEFKETPIGKIPKDWKVVSLGNEKVSVLVKSGSTPLKRVKDYWNGNIPFVTQADMTKVDHYLYETSEKITEAGLKSSNLLLVPENSILLSMYGTIGKVVINKTPLAVSQNIAAIILNKKNVDEEYLYYVIQKYSSQFKGRAKIITLKHLDIKIVKNTLLPLPPIPEQWRIAEILSTIDEAIQKTNEIIAKTERLKKGLMQELLTKGIGHKEFKDTEIGRIPKEWEVVKLSEIGTFQYGMTISATNEDTGIKFLRITDIKEDGTIDWSEVPYCKVNEQELKKYGLKIGDLLFARIGATTGKTCYINQYVKGIFGSYLIRLQPTISGLWTKFLFYYTQSNIYWTQVNRIKEGQLKKGLNTQLLRLLKLPLPPLNEQKKIAEILSTIDKKLEIERKERTRLERIKQGMMDLLLTGKIRVRI